MNKIIIKITRFILEQGSTKWTRGIAAALEPLVQASGVELVFTLLTRRSW